MSVGKATEAVEAAGHELRMTSERFTALSHAAKALRIQCVEYAHHGGLDRRLLEQAREQRDVIHAWLTEEATRRGAPVDPIWLPQEEADGT